MQNSEIIIIGAGLSGLYAAWLLQKAGKDCLLLEGRRETGGRIKSVSPYATTPASAVDLGATWVWPALQPELMNLLRQLNLPLLEQNEHGDLLFERSAHEPANRHAGYISTPAPLRVEGGLSTLTSALERELRSGALIIDRRVRRIDYTASGCSITATNEAGESYCYHSQSVFLALPPALAANIEYEPALPAHVLTSWQQTPTWMAPHAKYVAVYANDFWRERGLSGEARSSVGPMAEIHDASVPGSVYALFGFLGVPARSRWTADEKAIKNLCLAQLTRIFGEQARTPVAEFYKDWSLDPFTATTGDLQLQPGHRMPLPASSEAPWLNRLVAIASEWSPSFPGYVAGAIESANAGVERYLASTATPPSF